MRYQHTHAHAHTFQSNGNGSDAHLFAVGTTLIPSSFTTAPATRDNPWNPRQAVGIPWYKSPTGYITESIFREVMGLMNRYGRGRQREKGRFIFQAYCISSV